MSNPDEIADVFESKGAKNVVIKLGKEGSYLRLAGETRGRIFPSVQGVKAVDTTGAGDSFCAGFLAAMARDEKPERAIEIANVTGALCVMATGATTGTRSYEEVLKFKEEQEC